MINAIAAVAAKVYANEDDVEMWTFTKQMYIQVARKLKMSYRKNGSKMRYAWKSQREMIVNQAQIQIRAESDGTSGQITAGDGIGDGTRLSSSNVSRIVAPSADLGQLSVAPTSTNDGTKSSKAASLTLDELPHSLLITIFNHLTEQDLSRVSQVCTCFKDTAVLIEFGKYLEKLK